MERTADQAKESQQKQKRSNQESRYLGISSIRAVEGSGNERKRILSFSSEEPYNRWWGTEILDHSTGCADLTRLNEIGCLLFNHNRDVVIGKVNKAWIEDNRGCAEVEFDTDAEAEKIYQKVVSGTLKGVSVAYQIDSWEEVLPNKISADGRFTGPASIARKWTPYEVSIVSVPADPTVGVGRDINDNIPKESNKESIRTLDYFERQLQINKNHIGGNN
jgi:HK97 family phage prohead protease